MVTSDFLALSEPHNHGVPIEHGNADRKLVQAGESIAQERAASTTSGSPWKPELSVRTPRSPGSRPVVDRSPVAQEPKGLQQAYDGRLRKSGCLVQMLNTVKRWRFILFQKREGASNRLDGGSGAHGVLLNMLFSPKPRFSLVPYSGTMRQATGCRSAFGDQWPQITSARRFPGWTGSPTGQVAPTIQPGTSCCRFRPLAMAEVPSVQSYMKRYGQEELQ